MGLCVRVCVCVFVCVFERGRKRAPANVHSGCHVVVWHAVNPLGRGALALSPLTHFVLCIVYVCVMWLQVNTGGGVWRLKWHPCDSHLLLAACMYAGFAVLRVDAASGTAGTAQRSTLPARPDNRIAVAERYPHHQSLAYGASWCAEVGEGGQSLVATCSFYDRLLHLWSPGTRAGVV